MTARTGFPKRHQVSIAAGAHLTADSPILGSAVEMEGRKGVAVWVDVTADPDTVSIVVKLQAYDETADAWTDIPGAAFAAIAAISHTGALKVYPGIAETANVSVNDVVPATIRAVATHTGGTTLTYSVEMDMIA